jgi:hypothetical protein
LRIYHILLQCNIWAAEPADGHCRVRYDDERGKGDHRHVNGVEQPYDFVSLSKLLDDFQHDVEDWR